MAKWLDNGGNCASYKGITWLEGIETHHFMVKPREVEHMTLDYYMTMDNVSPDEVGSENGGESSAEPPTIDALPYFVQLRIGADLDDEEAQANRTTASMERYIAYQFTHFEKLDALPADVSIFTTDGAGGHFNEPGREEMP